MSPQLSDLLSRQKRQRPPVLIGQYVVLLGRPAGTPWRRPAYDGDMWMSFVPPPDAAHATAETTRTSTQPDAGRDQAASGRDPGHVDRGRATAAAVSGRATSGPRGCGGVAPTGLQLAGRDRRTGRGTRAVVVLMFLACWTIIRYSGRQTTVT